jgi:hypothetical protein
LRHWNSNLLKGNFKSCANRTLTPLTHCNAPIDDLEMVFGIGVGLSGSLTKCKMLVLFGLEAEHVLNHERIPSTAIPELLRVEQTTRTRSNERAPWYTCKFKN